MRPFNLVHNSSSRNVTEAIAGRLLGGESDKLCDAIVISSDEERLAVVRALLAVRSGYFDSLFFADASGRAATEIHLPFHMKIVKQVVEYAYTDTAPRVQNLQDFTERWKDAKPKQRGKQFVPCEDIVEIVELAEASDFVQMGELTNWCCQTITEVIDLSPRSGCAALGAIRERQGAVPMLERVASYIVRDVASNPQNRVSLAPCTSFQPPDSGATRSCFGASGLCTIMHLNCDTLEEIVSASPKGFDNEYLLQLVYFWATGGERISKREDDEGPTVQDERDSGDDEDREECPQTDAAQNASGTINRQPEDPAARERWCQGKELAQKFNLPAMNPSFLHDYVEQCGIVNKDILYRAFRHHAISPTQLKRTAARRSLLRRNVLAKGKK